MSSEKKKKHSSLDLETMVHEFYVKKKKKSLYLCFNVN